MVVNCAIDGTSEFCQAARLNEEGQTIDLRGNPDKRNWFFSIRVFDTAGPRRIFKTLAEAIAYDQARFSESSPELVSINPSGALASITDAGWKYFFDHGAPTAPTTVTKGDPPQVFDIYRTDERVASNTAVEQGCGFWNTMQPAIAADAWNEATNCPVNTPCKAGRTQLAYTYSAKPGTGEPCLLTEIGSNTVVRSMQHESLVPPHIGKLVAYVASGQVSFGLTSVRVPGGGSNISLGDPVDVTSITEWLPVDRRMHDCRHAQRDGAAPACR
jgi:hypothetical protein